MSETKSPHGGLTRRSFLKTTGAVAGAAAVAGAFTPALQALAQDSKAVDGDRGEEVFSTICRSNCFQACMLNAHVLDGKVRKMTRGNYPDEIYSGSCLRGLAIPERVYSATRIKYPMRRIGERGADQWERISWDEAIEEIAAKFTDIRERYGTRAVVYESASGNYGSIQGNSGMSVRFCNALEMTRLGVCYDVAYGYGTNRVVGGTIRGYPPEAKNMLHSKHILIWGANPVFAQPQTWRIIRRAQERGARLTCIDPMFSASAARSDEYVPVRAGSDLYVVLAMINEVISNDMINELYVKRHTTAPFLLRKDNGLILRQSDIEGGEMAGVRDAKTLTATGSIKKDPAYVWDETSGSAALYTECKTPVLEGSFTVNGIEVETVYTALKRHMAQYTVEDASGASLIPVDTIKELARRYAEDGPVFIYSVYAIDHYCNGHLFAQAISILCALTDNISRLGSGVGAGSMSVAVLGLGGAVNSGWTKVDGGKKASYGSIPQADFANVVSSGKHKGKDFPVKALMVSCSNPISNWAQQGLWFSDILPNLEFVVTLDTEMTDTARYSDIVLPVAFWLETDDYRTNQANPYVVYGQKAIEPLHESKLDSEIFALIADKMGLGDDVPLKPPREWIELSLDSDKLRDAGFTPKTLEEQKAIRAIGSDDLPYVPGYGGAELKTPSGRAELYCECPVPRLDFGQDWKGDAEKEHFPYFLPPYENWYKGETFKKYPISFVQVHERWRTHSQWFAVESLRELDPEPLVHVSREDAEARGIVDGDIVEVFNDRGHVVVKAIVDDACSKGFAFMPKGWQINQCIEGCMQELTTTVVHPLSVNYSYYDVLADIRKR